jgi:hypothetical protein
VRPMIHDGSFARFDDQYMITQLRSAQQKLDQKDPLYQRFTNLLGFGFHRCSPHRSLSRRRGQLSANIPPVGTVVGLSESSQQPWRGVQADKSRIRLSNLF